METIKYIYVVIISTLIVVFALLIKQLAKLMKKTAALNNNIDELKNNISKTNHKVEDIKETKESWKFFATTYIVYAILKETIKDYMNSSILTRGIAKSFTKTCVKNVSKLNKIKIK